MVSARATVFAIVTVTALSCVESQALVAQTAPSSTLGGDSALAARADSAFAEQTGESISLAIRLWTRLAAAQQRRGDAAEAADALASAGFGYLALSRADSAAVAFRRAMSLAHQASDTTVMGRVFDGLGRVELSRGRPDSGLVLLRLSLVARRAVGDRSGEGSTLANIGAIYSELARADSALAYFTTALPILRDVADTSSELSALNNIGLTQRALGRSDSALFYFRRAEALAKSSGDREGEATTISNMGLVFDDLRDLEIALDHYRRALAIDRELGFAAQEAATLNNIGVIHRWSGRPDSSLAAYGRALTIQRELGDPAQVGRVLHNIGLIHGDAGRADSSLSYLRRALAAARTTNDRWWEGMTLHEIGRVLQRPGGRRDLSGAIARYDSAAVVFASVAAGAGGDAGRYTFAERRNLLELFHDWTLAWLARAPEVGARRAALGALAATERGRAQALLELLQRSQPVRDRSARGGGLGNSDENHLRSVARGGTAAVAYYAVGDTLLIWLLTPDGDVSVERRTVAFDSLTALVGELRSGIGATTPASRAIAFDDTAASPVPALGTPADSANGPAERLARLLIPARLTRAPANAIQELVIVPFGPLGMVPFTVLPFGAHDALGNRFAIRYTPSLATLRTIEGSSRSLARGATTSLVVGNPTMPVIRQGSRMVLLDPLPAAEREADSVAVRLGVSALIGSAATEDAVRRRLTTSRIVHLATHGFAFSTEARARQSFIALAPGSGSDGMLTVGEIIDELGTVRADLVVLSACQTGLGNLKQAEGTVGLQRAFLAKGARSVLVSLWNVSDEATELLMNRFYAHWLDDADKPDKAESLRRAQGDVRARPRFQEPMYWAAFQVVGAR